MPLPHSSRREFLLTSLATATGLAACSNSGKSHLTPLQALVDTLVPSDATPGALHYGLDEQILIRSAVSKHLQDSVQSVLEFCESSSQSGLQSSFTQLKIEQRDALLRGIYTEDTPQSIKSAFSIVRRNVMDLYYQQPDVQTELGFVLPSLRPNY